MDGLDRAVAYLLVFDQDAFRWEIEPMETGPSHGAERSDATAADATTRGPDRPQLRAVSHR
jgi:hypothetical protein